MLEDLEQCLQTCRARADSIPINRPFNPSPEIWQEIVKAYKINNATDAVEVVNNTLVVTTQEKNFLSISAQEIPRCWAVGPYVNSTRAYEEKVNELAQKLGFPSRSSQQAEVIFRRLPNLNWETELDPEHVKKIKLIITEEMGLTNDEQRLFFRFLSDKNWSGVGKKLERLDWRISAIQSAGGWLAVAAARRGELADALSKSTNFESLFTAILHEQNAQAITSTSSEPRIGKNSIIYGAPGTGKSHKIDALVSGLNVIRTVFHPDTQNSDFFGCLKPRMNGDKVTYQFSPGPFALALKSAYLNSDKHNFLVIEEINRAPAAAVFGELFQLLDRKDDGCGTYEVDFPNPESKSWFQDEVGASIDKLHLPSNLSIFATMNSADQGVYPLDTAFRRRWEQEYLPLYEDQGPSGDIHFIDSSGEQRTIGWRSFVKCLNDYLTESLDVAEDRLLGLWFIRERELNKQVPAKILLYLWDDLLRHEGREKIFLQSIRTFGQLDSAIKANKTVFSSNLLAALEELSNPVNFQSADSSSSQAGTSENDNKN